MKRLIGAVLILGIVAVACGDGAVATDPETEAREAPILTIGDIGGFVPVEFALSRGPRFVLTDQDRLIYEGPQVAIFPGPLMPSLVAAQLTSDDLEEVMGLVDRAGLPEITTEVNDSASLLIADAPTTVFTFVDDQGEHRFEVYALGIGEFDDPRITVLEELLNALAALSGSREGQPYESDAIQVIVGPAASSGDPAEVIEPWPLSDPSTDLPQMFGDFSCQTYGEESADNPVDVLAAAHEMTLWQEGEQTHRILARQLFPGETGCQPAI